MNNIIERPTAAFALSNYQQADEDGVMVLVSRQAVDEVLAELDAMKGMWGQYSMDYGPFIEHAQKNWAENRKWVFDSSHDVSTLSPDGTRRKVGTFQHASDAEEAELAVNGVRSGRLVDLNTLAERDAKIKNDALREAVKAVKDDEREGVRYHIGRRHAVQAIKALIEGKE